MTANDPKITLTLPGSVLAHIHHIAAVARDRSEPDEPAYEPMRDAARAIEGALRAHGWRPGEYGRWYQ